MDLYSRALKNVGPKREELAKAQVSNMQQSAVCIQIVIIFMGRFYGYCFTYRHYISVVLYTVISQNWIFFVIIIKTHKNNNNISDKKLIKKSKQYYKLL